MAAKKRTAPKKSRWAQLVAEAKQNYVPAEPYEFDAVNPPILITAPDTLERSLALASLLDSGGTVAVRDLEPMIAALVGREAFAVVWNEIRDEPVEVAMALVEDLNRHFEDSVPDESVAELPGGEQDS